MIKNGNVLFIIHDLYQEDNYFPLGIGYMAAVLKRKGVNVDVYKELILDHYEHTTKNMNDANKLIDNFYSLYFEGSTQFRGARHYEK